jgi:hypothetical protein
MTDRMLSEQLTGYLGMRTNALRLNICGSQNVKGSG